MSQEFTTIDVEAFARTAQLFALKRQALAPSAVEALATDIVARLVRTAKATPHFDAGQINPNSVAAFCDALIETEPFAALRFIEQRRADGVTRHGVYLGYIAAAAQELGERWEQDLLPSALVTIGTGHLYALMRALRAETPAARPAYDARKYALFATVPGEQHGIGITIAADLFRDAGWEIDLQVGADHEHLLTRVENTAPPIIGLSLSTRRQLEGLIRLVVAMRIVHPTAIIGVAPSSDLDKAALTSLVDIDLVFDDAQTACDDLERLIRLRR